MTVMSVLRPKVSKAKFHLAATQLMPAGSYFPEYLLVDKTAIHGNPAEVDRGSPTWRNSDL